MPKRQRSWLVLLVAITLCVTPVPGARAQDADQPPPPPWTQEKTVPKEVKEHENDKPLGTCATGVIYRDDKTGEMIEIEYKVKKGKVQWIITKTKPNTPTTVTKYEIDPNNPSDIKKTVKTGDGKSQDAQVAKDDFVEQTPKTASATPGTQPAPKSDAPKDATPKSESPKGETPKTTGGTTPSTPKRAPEPTPTTPKAETPPPTAMRTDIPTGAPTGAPVATTVERPMTPPGPKTSIGEPPGPIPATVERPPVNIKPVTYGGPPPETTITFEPGKPEKPVDVAKIPDIPRQPGEGPGQSHWGPDDGEGPQTGIPVDGGGPGRTGGGQTVRPDDGGFIHVGFGWASTTIPSTFVNSCVTEEVDDENSPEAQRERLKTIARNREAASGAKPMTQVRDCADIAAEMNQLLGRLRAIHDSNVRHAQAASKAFWGDPANKYVDGYKAYLNRSEVTKAQVDGANAAGKAMIDAALFAFGYGGLFPGGKFQKVADTLLGKGLRGAEEAADVYVKIAQKALSKTLDAQVDSHKLGTGAAAEWKTIEKWDDKYWQGATGAIESILRGKIVDGIGDWMKTGASAADVERAKNAYADFMAHAESANVDAAAADLVLDQLRDAIETAKANGCPTVDIPDYKMYRFDTAPYGMGTFIGQKGPIMSEKNLKDGASTGRWDMFARNSGPGAP